MDRINLNETNFTTIERVEEAQKVDTKKKNVLSTWTCSYMKFEDVNDNNRWYSREIVNKKVLNKTVQDKLKNGKGLLGEIDHPAERFTTNLDFVAICTTNLWLDEKKNELWGTFDVLDTPRGRIVHTLLEYGYPVGVSARAMGKTVERKGRQEVDVDSYMFKTFDAVTDPGFASSRVNVNEQNESINEALAALYESYTEEDKEIAKDLLETLTNTQEVIYSNESNETEEPISNGSVVEGSSQPINETVHEQKIKELESLLQRANKQICDLKSNIANNDTELIRLRDEISEANSIIEGKKEHINSLDEIIDSLKGENDDLHEQVETLKDDNKDINDKLTEAVNEIYILSSNNKLYESKLSVAQSTIKQLQDKITTLNESLLAFEEYNNELETLMEDNNQKEQSLQQSLNEAYQEIKDLKNEYYAPKKKKDLDIQVVEVINESKESAVDQTTFNLLKNLNKKGDK